jgi:hypothetical protein
MMMKYLNYPIGTVLEMRAVPDYRNPKRWYCQEVQLLLWFGWGSSGSAEARKRLRDYREEGISFQFRYY